MIVANYTNFKAGLCTDLEYFKFSYAGKHGEVKKKYVQALGRKHPFYIIKRPLLEKNRFEFKVYDFFHDGVIEKEVIMPIPDLNIKVPSLDTWWDKTLHKPYMKEYILFCKQTNR